MTSKKLSVSGVKALSKSVDKKQKVQINDEYHVYIYPQFGMLKLQKMFENFLKAPLEAEDQGIDMSKISMIDWLSFNVVKEFSDLDIPNDIKKQLEFYYELMNTDLLYPIFNSFPQESLEKISIISNRLQSTIEKLGSGKSEEFEQLIINTVAELEEK
ncbi:hypothetical protein [Bacillus amyloliquefaciens]|uniref:Uncharacterized protein n=1 Tax=Bacillus amyloliquefaciens TaxID=1390 RepID=A0AAP7N9I1_BACAM|nr:hypothetical protein [Bacillus amyloliquefaciens]OIK22685.1 hypothetical protein BKP66_03685 [Bacillus amyloliquefaciens]